MCDKRLTFFSKLTVCCLTPGAWLLRLGGRKWRIRSISWEVTASVLRWLSHTNPRASILTWWVGLDDTLEVMLHQIVWKHKN